MVYEVLLVISPLITAPYISRVLGAELIGLKSYTEAIVAYFDLFAVLGTATYGTREIARVRDDKKKATQLFWEIEILQLCTGGIVLLGWCIFIVLSGEFKLYYQILTIELFATILNITWFFNGFEKFDFVVIRNAIIKLLTIIAIFVFVKTKDDIVISFLITVISKLFSAMVTYTALPKYLVKTKLPDLGKHLRYHLSQTIIYFIPAIATSINKYLDKIILGTVIIDKRQSGFYEQTEKIVHLLNQIVFTAINSVLGVRASYLFSQKRYEEVKRKVSFSMEYAIFFGISCGFGIAAVAKHFVPLFYGPGYEPVIILIYIFCMFPTIQGISNCLGALYYIPSGNRRKSSRYLIVGALCNAFLNIVFIPSFGVYAAAGTTVFVQILIVYLYIHNCEGYMSFNKLFHILWKKLFSGIVMFGIVYFEGEILPLSDMVRVCIQILTGFFIYCGMELLLADKWFKTIVLKMMNKLIHKF